MTFVTAAPAGIASSVSLSRAHHEITGKYTCQAHTRLAQQNHGLPAEGHRSMHHETSRLQECRETVQLGVGQLEHQLAL